MPKEKKLRKMLKENLAKNMHFMESLIQEMFEEANTGEMELDEQVQTIGENLRVFWMYGHETIEYAPEFGIIQKIKFGTEEQVQAIYQKIIELIVQNLSEKPDLQLSQQKDFAWLIKRVIKQLEDWTTIEEIYPPTFLERVRMFVTLEGLHFWKRRKH